jgi:hypothetical protein
MTSIYNAKIINSEIRLGEYNELILDIKLDAGSIGTELVFGIGMIAEVMSIIHVRNAKDITGSYLRIRTKDGIAKEIGDIITERWINAF